MNEDYFVSVIIPARNESRNIENLVKRVPVLGVGTEIIFVEGHSTDDTWDKIQSIKEKYKHVDIKSTKQDGVGKWNAVKTGFDIAKGEVLMILDADATVSPEELCKFYKVINVAGGFINGTRFVYKMEKNAMRPLNFLGNKFFSTFLSLILNKRLTDTLCGTKVLFKNDYKKIKDLSNIHPYKLDPFGDFILLFGASELDLNIIEVPVSYKKREYGYTKIYRFKHGILLFWMTFLMTLRKIKLLIFK